MSLGIIIIAFPEKLKNTLIRFSHQNLLEYYHWGMKNSKLDGYGHIHRTDICSTMSLIFNFSLDNRYWLFFFVRTFTLQKKQIYFSKLFQCCFSLIDLVFCALYNWTKTVCFAVGMLFSHTHCHVCFNCRNTSVHDKFSLKSILHNSVWDAVLMLLWFSVPSEAIYKLWYLS